MPENRYYLNLPLLPGEKVLIKELEFHHLKVLRKKRGDPVELINGKGILAKGSILALEKSHAQVVVESVHRENPFSPKFILAQAIPKWNRLEPIIEKGTELGCFAFWLFPSENSEKKTITSTQLQRMEHLSISAMKQCGRLYLPEIKLMPTLEKWPKLEGRVFFGDLSPQSIPWKEKGAGSPLFFFIGPESGFSASERASLLTHLLATPISLHPHTLRVDTAAIVAMAFMSTSH
ncbi:MAG: 16S rRNA (uracil(1498)-N(3))-methyltransferase [Chlamydiae bacterium]|nr:16S rRNA (uracil(1498)-N(3))-methyltransferase [Chlamydiota bacterium]